MDPTPWACGFFHFLKSCVPLSSTTRRGESRHIVILGSLGVGKSSLVNMLIGKAVAPVSGGIDVVHPSVVEYSVRLDEITTSRLQPSNPGLVLRFYDTVGLEHRPSPWSTIKGRLRRSGGVDLVVYCLRHGRLSSEQLTHLREIWKTYCQNGVPLVLVVNGVDFRRGSTEEWWEESGRDLEDAVEVEFADHVCINTWDPVHPSWKLQSIKYEEAQCLVRDLVISHCIPDSI